MSSPKCQWLTDENQGLMGNFTDEQLLEFIRSVGCGDRGGVNVRDYGGNTWNLVCIPLGYKVDKSRKIIHVPNKNQDQVQPDPYFTTKHIYWVAQYRNVDPDDIAGRPRSCLDYLDSYNINVLNIVHSSFVIISRLTHVCHTYSKLGPEVPGSTRIVGRLISRNKSNEECESMVLRSANTCAWWLWFNNFNSYRFPSQVISRETRLAYQSTIAKITSELYDMVSTISDTM